MTNEDQKPNVDWPCDNHPEPATCLTVGSTEQDCCRICRIRAADRLIAAMNEPDAISNARLEVKAAVEEWFTDVSLDDLFVTKGWADGGAGRG